MSLFGKSIAINYTKSDQDDRIHFLTHIPLNLPRDADISTLISPTAYQICTSSYNIFLLKNYFMYSGNNLVPLNPRFTYYGYVCDEYFIVKTIKSHYNTGSMMLIFRGKFGTVLYTGYLNQNPSSLKPNAIHFIKNNMIRVDQLYLDATYLELEAPFSNKSQVISMLCQFFRSNNKTRYYLHIPFYGMEDVLALVASNIKEYLVVDHTYYGILKSLGYNTYFTTSDNKGRIKVISRMIFNKRDRGKSLRNVVFLRCKDHFCCKFQAYTKQKVSENVMSHQFTIYGHCNYYELEEWLKAIAPVQTVPLYLGSDAETSTIELPDTFQEKNRSDFKTIIESEFECFIDNEQNKNSIKKELKNELIKNKSKDQEVEENFLSVKRDAYEKIGKRKKSLPESANRVSSYNEVAAVTHSTLWDHNYHFTSNKESSILLSSDSDLGDSSNSSCSVLEDDSQEKNFQFDTADVTVAMPTKLDRSVFPPELSSESKLNFLSVSIIKSQQDHYSVGIQHVPEDEDESIIIEFPIGRDRSELTDRTFSNITEMKGPVLPSINDDSPATKDSQFVRVHSSAQQSSSLTEVSIKNEIREIDVSSESSDQSFNEINDQFDEMILQSNSSKWFNTTDKSGTALPSDNSVISSEYDSSDNSKNVPCSSTNITQMNMIFSSPNHYKSVHHIGDTFIDNELNLKKELIENGSSNIDSDHIKSSVSTICSNACHEDNNGMSKPIHDTRLPEDTASLSEVSVSGIMDKDGDEMERTSRTANCESILSKPNKNQFNVFLNSSACVNDEEEVEDIIVPIIKPTPVSSHIKTSPSLLHNSSIPLCIPSSLDFSSTSTVPSISHPRPSSPLHSSSSLVSNSSCYPPTPVVTNNSPSCQPLVHSSELSVSSPLTVPSAPVHNSSPSFVFRSCIPPVPHSPPPIPQSSLPSIHHSPPNSASFQSSFPPVPHNAPCTPLSFSPPIPYSPSLPNPQSYLTAVSHSAPAPHYSSSPIPQSVYLPVPQSSSISQSSPLPVRHSSSPPVPHPSISSIPLTSPVIHSSPPLLSSSSPIPHSSSSLVPHSLSSPLPLSSSPPDVSCSFPTTFSSAAVPYYLFPSISESSTAYFRDSPTPANCRPILSPSTFSQSPVLQSRSLTSNTHSSAPLLSGVSVPSSHPSEFSSPSSTFSLYPLDPFPPLLSSSAISGPHSISTMAKLPVSISPPHSLKRPKLNAFIEKYFSDTKVTFEKTSLCKNPSEGSTALSLFQDSSELNSTSSHKQFKSQPAYFGSTDVDTVSSSLTQNLSEVNITKKTVQPSIFSTFKSFIPQNSQPANVCSVPASHQHKNSSYFGQNKIDNVQSVLLTSSNNNSNCVVNYLSRTSDPTAGAVKDVPKTYSHAENCKISVTKSNDHELEEDMTAKNSIFKLKSICEEDVVLISSDDISSDTMSSMSYHFIMTAVDTDKYSSDSRSSLVTSDIDDCSDDHFLPIVEETDITDNFVSNINAKHSISVTKRSSWNFQRKSQFSLKNLFNQSKQTARKKIRCPLGNDSYKIGNNTVFSKGLNGLWKATLKECSVKLDRNETEKNGYFFIKKLNTYKRCIDVGRNNDTGYAKLVELNPACLPSAADVSYPSNCLENVDRSTEPTNDENVEPIEESPLQTSSVELERSENTKKPGTDAVSHNHCKKTKKPKPLNKFEKKTSVFETSGPDKELKELISSHVIETPRESSKTSNKQNCKKVTDYSSNSTKDLIHSDLLSVDKAFPFAKQLRRSEETGEILQLKKSFKKTRPHDLEPSLTPDSDKGVTNIKLINTIKPLSIKDESNTFPNKKIKFAKGIASDILELNSSSANKESHKDTNIIKRKRGRPRKIKKISASTIMDDSLKIKNLSSELSNKSDDMSNNLENIEETSLHSNLKNPSSELMGKSHKVSNDSPEIIENVFTVLTSTPRSQKFVKRRSGRKITLLNNCYSYNNQSNNQEGELESSPDSVTSNVSDSSCWRKRKHPAKCKTKIRSMVLRSLNKRCTRNSERKSPFRGKTY